MSQVTNVKLDILQAKCRAKVNFLKSSTYISDELKEKAIKIANSLDKNSPISEFVLLDEYLSDLLLITKMRQDQEALEMQYKLGFKMEDLNRFVLKLQR